MNIIFCFIKGVSLTSTKISPTDEKKTLFQSALQRLEELKPFEFRACTQGQLSYFYSVDEVKARYASFKSILPLKSTHRLIPLFVYAGSQLLTVGIDSPKADDRMLLGYFISTDSKLNGETMRSYLNLTELNAHFNEKIAEIVKETASA